MSFGDDDLRADDSADPVLLAVEVATLTRQLGQARTEAADRAIAMRGIDEFVAWVVARDLGRPGQHVFAIVPPAYDALAQRAQDLETALRDAWAILASDVPNGGDGAAERRYVCAWIPAERLRAIGAPIGEVLP